MGRVPCEAVCLLACVTACATACRSNDVRTPVVPPDVAWVSVVYEDLDQQFVRAGPLAKFDPQGEDALAHVLDESSPLVRIVGYTREQITDYSGDASEAKMLEVPLVLSAPCTEDLPVPRWTVLMRTAEDSGEPLSDDVALAPKLTASWVVEPCRIPIEGALQVDFRCTIAPCIPDVTRVGACSLSIDLDNCNFGHYEGRVDIDGSFCLDGASPVTDCAGDVIEKAAPEAFAELTCTQPTPCEVIAYGPAQDRFDVETFPVIEGVEPRAHTVINLLGKITQQRFYGYFSDFIVMKDRIAAVTYGGAYFESLCSQVPTQTRFFDRTPGSYRQIATATTPPCLGALVTDPETETQFYGVYGSTAAPYFGVFSQEGVLTASVALNIPIAGRPHERISAIASPVTDEIIVQFNYDIPESPSPFQEGILVVAFDRHTLAQRVIADRSDNISYGLTSSPEGVLGFPGEFSEVVYYVDVEGGEVTIAFIDTLASYSIGHILYHPPSQRYLISVPSNRNVVNTLTQRGLDQTRRFFERDGAPYASELWPAEPALVLVGAMLPDPPYDSMVTLFNPEEAYFYPGAKTIGYGPPGKMIADKTGVFVSLPWEAKIAYVTRKR